MLDNNEGCAITCSKCLCGRKSYCRDDNGSCVLLDVPAPVSDCAKVYPGLIDAYALLVSCKIRPPYEVPATTSILAGMRLDATWCVRLHVRLEVITSLE